VRLHRILPAPILAITLGIAGTAHADEFREAADNATVPCTVSAHELTRIALSGDQFASVSKISSGTPYNDFAVTNEPVRGDIYLSVPPAFAANKLGFFATTRKGMVYKFACNIAPIDATQVFVTNPALAKSDAASWEAQTPQASSAVRLIQAMAVNATLPGFEVRQLAAQPVRIGGLELQLIAQYRGAAKSQSPSRRAIWLRKVRWRSAWPQTRSCRGLLPAPSSSPAPGGSSHERGHQHRAARRSTRDAA
jgi:conjugal transfer pilus assembly protein TraK